MLLEQGILSNPNLMEIEGCIELIRYVPSYMYWCASNPDREGELVFDFTVSALAEFGRCTDPQNSSLNFRYLCNAEQKAVVIDFLNWCKSELYLCNKAQIDRAIIKWSVS